MKNQILSPQNRRTYNLLILNKLKEIVERYPELRFGQIIECFAKDKDIDFFNEEPDSIYNRIIKKCNEYGC